MKYKEYNIVVHSHYNKTKTGVFSATFDGSATIHVYSRNVPTERCVRNYLDSHWDEITNQLQEKENETVPEKKFDGALREGSLTIKYHRSASIPKDTPHVVFFNATKNTIGLEISPAMSMSELRDYALSYSYAHRIGSTSLSSGIGQHNHNGARPRSISSPTEKIYVNGMLARIQRESSQYSIVCIMSQPTEVLVKCHTTTTLSDITKAVLDKLGSPDAKVTIITGEANRRKRPDAPKRPSLYERPSYTTSSEDRQRDLTELPSEKQSRMDHGICNRRYYQVPAQSEGSVIRRSYKGKKGNRSRFSYGGSPTPQYVILNGRVTNFHDINFEELD